jgi:cation diffusion facilitator family transporter
MEPEAPSGPRSKPKQVEAMKRTALLSIAAAAALVALKLGAGMAIGSLGLISAGIESTGDVVAAVMTLLAIRVAGKPPDSNHHYGHGRAENLAALGEALILLIGGTVVVWQAVQRLLAGQGHHQLEASWVVFAVLGVAIAVDISRTVTSIRTSRHYGSAALRSNAFHFGADMAGTLAVVVGLIFARAGHQNADAFAALFVSALIFTAAGRLIVENVRSLMDVAPAKADAAARRALESLEGIELRRLRVRELAGRHFADVVVGVPAASALVQGHDAAERVENSLRSVLPDSDVVVHVEPRDETLLADRVLAATLRIPGVHEAHNVTVFELAGRREVSLHLKVPADLSLAEGHRIADEVEQAILLHVPEVKAAHTHLEPLDSYVDAKDFKEGELHAGVEQIVRAATGTPPRELRLVASDRGVVCFLTVALEPRMTVSQAHRVASQIESSIHREIPQIADVVAHIEP